MGERPFKCPECGETFTNNSQVHKHRRETHTALKYYCPVCGSEYNCFISMKRHALKSHGYKEERKRNEVSVKFKLD